MVITIAVSHLEFLGAAEGEHANLYDFFFHNARMGVSFFFILSGFGLTYSFLRKPYSEQHEILSQHWSLLSGIKFAMNRVSRLYKWYLITMALFIPVDLVNMLDYRNLSGAIKIIGFKAVMSIGLVQSIFAQIRFSHSFNAVCWFLSTLFILYIFYPLIQRCNMRIVNKAYEKRNVFTIKLCLLFIFSIYIIIHLLFSIVADRTSFTDLAYGSPYIRVFDFIIGMLICDLSICQRHISWWNKSVFSILEVIISSAFVLWFFLRNAICYGEKGPYGIYEETKNLVDICIVCVLIYIFSYEAGVVSKFMKKSFMVKLGGVAMYIFLAHYPVRIISYRLLTMKFDETLGLKILELIITIFGTAVAVYYMRRFDKNRTIRRKGFESKI